MQLSSRPNRRVGEFMLPFTSRRSRDVCSGCHPVTTGSPSFTVGWGALCQQHQCDRGSLHSCPISCRDTAFSIAVLIRTISCHVRGHAYCFFLLAREAPSMSPSLTHSCACTSRRMRSWTFSHTVSARWKLTRIAR